MQAPGFDAGRRRLGFAAASACALGPLHSLSGCAIAGPRAYGWEGRLREDAVVLLGEVHDHAEQHRLRLGVLKRALGRGWRPAIAMEQFDADRQPDIERARRERPRDAGHLIAQASPGAGGWEWSLYRPVVALALEHELPLVAANLPRDEAMRLVRSGYEAVLGPDRARELGLLAQVPAEWQSAHEREIDAGHCAALPPAMLPGMARAQLARDAHMASRLRSHAARGAVLLAGNGHVRRDIGVPRWLAGALAPNRVWSVGFLERSNAQAMAQAFDAAVITADLVRAEDPCAGLTEKRSVG